MPSGTLNQILIGSVLIFSVKDVEEEVDDLTPLAADRSIIADFGFSVIESFNPDTVSELCAEKK